MTHQPDLFGDNRAETRSFPPHLDPARARRFVIRHDTDRDHIAAPVDGRLPVGALGNNRDTWLAQVLDDAGKILASFPYDTEFAAQCRLDDLKEQLNANRQTTFL